LKGITVLAFHSSSAFTVILASKLKSIEDLDNFGEIVQSIDMASVAILAEISYFQPFLLAIIVIKDSSPSDRFISKSSQANQLAIMLVSLSSIFIFSITVVTLSFHVITRYHSKSWIFISGVS
jgi:hypothetical protein